MFQRLLCFFALLIAVSACHPTTPPPRLGKPQFSGAAFQFDAMDIDIVQSSPASPSDVQSRYQFPTRLDSGMEQWIKDRIVLRGGENRLKLDIEEASVTEEKLPVTKGFAGLFKDEQSRRYKATLKVSLSLYTPDRPTSRAGVESEASRFITLSEDASVAQRQQAFNDLVISVLQQVDSELSHRIPQHFSEYLEGY